VTHGKMVVEHPYTIGPFYWLCGHVNYIVACVYCRRSHMTCDDGKEKESILNKNYSF
jgi:hypothetical protein